MWHAVFYFSPVLDDHHAICCPDRVRAMSEEDARFAVQRAGKLYLLYLTAGECATDVADGRLAIPSASRRCLPGLYVSRFDAVPLIAFIAAKETNYGTEANG